MCIALLAVGGCSQAFSEKPTLATRTQSLDDLLKLPPPRTRLDTAVFRFLDQTGQHKPNDTFAEYSFAVTQGGTNLLIKALHDAGAGSWFRVVERSNIGDLLQERQIVRANRIQYAGPKGAVQPLGPLLNAGTIFEGGIVGYDSNIVTGGAGANYLGIGASVQYRKDTVTVALRTVSTLTGEVLTAVEVSKTIFSTLLDASIFKFVDFNKLLQAEVGFSTNEPVTICVEQAVELAVYATIMEGALKGYWSFADEAVQARLTADYIKTRGGILPYVAGKAAPAPTPIVHASPSNGAPPNRPATAVKPAAATSKPAAASSLPERASTVPATSAPPRPAVKPRAPDPRPSSSDMAAASPDEPAPATNSKLMATIADLPAAASKPVATIPPLPAAASKPAAMISDPLPTASKPASKPATAMPTMAATTPAEPAPIPALPATASTAPVTSLKLPPRTSNPPPTSLKLPPMPARSD
jgi:curli production assembly/transport component CsgG